MEDEAPIISSDHQASVVRVKIGNKAVDARKVKSCLTCNHPARMAIEEMLLHGESYQAIIRRFSEVKYTVGGRQQVLPKIDYKTLRAHYTNGHMPLEATVVRDLIEKRAAEVGSDYEAIGKRFADKVLFAQMVVAKGQQRLATGEIQPDVKETLAAAKFLQDVEDASKGAEGTEIWAQAMEVYFTVARQVMNDETWSRFVALLDSNTILRGIAKRLNNSDVLDAELVDEV